jgi:hypothetical protein
MSGEYSKCKRCEKFYLAGLEEAMHIHLDRWVDIDIGSSVDLCKECSELFKLFLKRLETR